MQAETVIVMTMLDFFGEGDRNQNPGGFGSVDRKDVYAYVKSLDNKWLLSRKGKQEKAKGQDKSHYSKQYAEFPWTLGNILADGSWCRAPRTSMAAGSSATSTKNLWPRFGAAQIPGFQADALSMGDFGPDFSCALKLRPESGELFPETMMDLKDTCFSRTVRSWR